MICNVQNSFKEGDIANSLRLRSLLIVLGKFPAEFWTGKLTPLADVNA